MNSSIYQHYDHFILPKGWKKDLDKSQPDVYKRFLNFVSSTLKSLKSQQEHLPYLSISLSLHLSDCFDTFQTKAGVESLQMQHKQCRQLADQLSSIYEQLSCPYFIEFKSKATTIAERKDFRLQQELAGWINQVIPPFLPDDAPATSGPENLSGLLAAGLILLHFTLTSSILYLCPKVLRILDLCQGPSDCVLSSVLNLREACSCSTNTDQRWREIVCKDLKEAVMFLVRRNGTEDQQQPLLGFLLFLSFWTSDENLFELRKLFVQAEAAEIQYYVFAKPTAGTSWILSSYEAARDSTLVKRCPKMMEVFLQIAPLTNWPKMVNGDCLSVMLQVLPMRLCEQPFATYEVIDNALKQFLVTSRSLIEDDSFKWKLEDSKNVSDCTFQSAYHILFGQYQWPVRYAAVGLCLCTYRLAADESKYLKTLADAVNHSIANAVSQEYGYTRLSAIAVFGASCESGYKFELNVWQTITEMCPKSWDTFHALWREACLEHILRRHKGLEFLQKLKLLEVLESLDSQSPDLVKALLDDTLEEFSSFELKRQEDLVKSHSRSDRSGHFRQLMIRFLKKRCPEPSKVDLGQLCTWSMWPCFFKVFELFKDTSTDMESFHHASELLTATVTSLQDGSIKVKELDIISGTKRNTTTFCEMASCINTDFKPGDLQSQLTAMVNLQIAFSDNYDCILKMINGGKLHLSKEGKTECSTIDDFKSSTLIKPVRSLNPCLKSCCPDGLFEELREVSQRFNNCFETCSCQSIDVLWSKMSQPYDLTTLVRVVWPQFQRKLLHLVQDWEASNITCAKADSLMPRADEEKELTLLVKAVNIVCKELVHSSTSHSSAWITSSVQKLQHYRKAKDQHTAALTLSNLKASLKIMGVYTALDFVISTEGLDHKPLSSISQEMGQVIDFLDVQDQHLEALSSCAKALVNSTGLIDWIKAEVKNAGELRTFIHMAQMAHCEDASTRDCLADLKVILKLAPFIFEVKPDCTLPHLVECCKSVMAENLKLDTIPGALDKCNRSLNKYKEIQKTLGSVGQTVYGQVRDLVNSARFTLQAPPDAMCSSIHDLVMVHVSSAGATKQQYSCSDLLDLQSKLALIRDEYIEDTSNQEGQGTEQDSERENVKEMAECFWEGLELTVRGADALLELLVAGHTPSRKYKLSYKLAGHEGSGSIKELKVAVQNLEEQLSNWRDEIEKARMECYELNYFTAQQLSMICRELSRRTCSTTKEPLPLWFTSLLQSVSPVVNQEYVLYEFNSMIEDKQEQTSPSFAVRDRQTADSGDSCGDEKSESASKSSVIATIDELNESERKLFDELSLLEYDDSVILRGIASLGYNFEAVSVFCLNSSESTELSPHETDSICSLNSLHCIDEHTTSEGTDAISQIIAHGYDLDFAKKAYQLFPDNLDGALRYCLENVSYYLERRDSYEAVQDELETFELFAPVQDEQYLEENVYTSIADVPDKDFWTLAEIAHFLHRISQLHSEDGQSAFSCPRSFATTGFAFEADSPNLLIVPRRHIFRTVLSLYMYSENLPLPTGEEVLFCRKETTAEEIRLLWRRAVGDPGCKRIFCLVCEHSLPHKVAKEAVQDMRWLLRGHKDFRIVVICCQEDEGASLLVGDLREYKRSTPSLPTEIRIVKYLQMHLCEPHSSSVMTGCDIDPEGSYVRVITSARAGMGKSLYVQRLIGEYMTCNDSNEDILKVVTLHGPDIDRDTIVHRLMSIDENCCDSDVNPRLYHFDISGRLLEAVGAHMFCILILGTLQSSGGTVWRRRRGSLYAVEIVLPRTRQGCHEGNCSSDLFQLLPTTHCRSPAECLKPIPKLKGSSSHQKHVEFLEMDEDLRVSCPYQRAFQYLHRFSQGQSVDNFDFVDGSVEGVSSEWIRLITRYSGIPDPTWAELSHFVSFLNNQLAACEKSIYCDSSLVSDESMGVTGFKSFVVKFMIRMSVDFTVPSIESEVEPSQNQLGEDESPELEGYQIVKRRAWEFSVHPYIFFNREIYLRREDEEHYDSMTFVGFNLQQVGKSINLVDLQHQIIEEGIMTEGLYRWLRQSGVEVRQNVSEWTKLTILKMLSRVLESKINFDPDQNDFYFKQIDPDPTYELTFDNLVKILAIQMRFRCGIPVVIMGETGCGKTRLIRYMCQLQSYLAADPNKPGSAPPGQTFFIMKMHGGVSEKDIAKFLFQVRKDAQLNQEQGFSTVVFFDEANTSDAIGLIKEVMCDGRIRGQSITEDIKFIAACNPYKKHSDDMITKLESAGLGFSVRHEETRQKLGTTPLRHLVYRVLELPASMKPLIYDYGGLKENTEEVYIHRMVANHVNRNAELGTIPQLTETITSILSWCHLYMRDRNDECSYVSLRDVERCMIVFSWFHQMFNTFAAEDGFHELTLYELFQQPEDCDTTVSVECTMAMILALAVCYCTRLDDRSEFERLVVRKFAPPLVLADGVQTFTETIIWCQRTFLSNMELGPNIAYNAALRENVFMMTVCVELRIPLFLVGKPGSSKSLAKSVVSTSMKGRASEKRFLKNFKSIELLSYQCSQHSTPQSVIDVFHSAKHIQESEDCSKHVAVVVLDEVGLAEDSPSLPLKALHPLLEDGTDGTDPKEIQVVEREERVGFIGISNWALDPAKMNRGIMVKRGNPDVEELVISARGICSDNEQNVVGDYLQSMLVPLATAYFEIMKSQEKLGQRKDFFGLRDFYSLIKMLHWMVSSGISRDRGLNLTKEQLKHAVLRNFGGLSPTKFQPWDFFKECCEHIEDQEEVDDPDCEPLGLIIESLNRSDLPDSYSENRYLLFLTENDAALQIMQDYLVHTLPKPPYVLFGSSFPKDKDYTQVCRNINQIKICMETGRTIVLLNLDNLYESLYDLLNQYYTRSMDNRYVDLGLQTHRIKCRVHNDFKLILIAEKSNVYDRFPIPLINRLEKHLVTASTIMTEEQSSICEELTKWVEQMSRIQVFKPEDVFVGYQTETPISVVLQAYKELGDCKVIDILEDDWELKVLELSKRIMIRMACPDALARLKQTDLMDDTVEIWDIYFKEQQHLSLSQLILATVSDISHFDPTQTPESSLPPLASRQNSDTLGSDKSRLGMLLQVTTFSQPLAPVDVSSLRRLLEISKEQLLDMYLEEVEAESDFTDRIRKHVQNVTEGDAYILIQCSLGHLSKDLISCARHKAVDILENLKKDDLWKRKYKTRNRKVHVIFVISLPKQPGGSRFIAFQGGLWMCVHLDDLRSPDDNALNFHLAVGTPLSELFYPGQEGVELHRRLDKCLAAAVAGISYADAQDTSKEDILKTLREAFYYRTDEGSLTFRDVLVQKHILCLLQNKEESFLKMNEPHWAVREAMDPDRLQEGGTFLNTLLTRVDLELTLALTSILTFVNQHSNLRLYNDDRFRALWVEIFENPRLCTFSLDKTNVEAQKDAPLVKKTKSSRIGQYTCQMPFSWMFIEAVQADILTSPQSGAVLFNNLYDASRSSGPGAFLHSTASAFEGIEQLYLEDFVAGIIVTRSRCPTEAEVLKKYITVLSDALLSQSKSKFKPLLLQVLAYHVVYHNNKDEFTRYQELGRTFPDLHEAMLAKVTPDVSKPLDILAVEEILESKVKPKPAIDKDFWKLNNLRDRYIKVLRQCQSTIDETLRNTSHNCHKLRCTWQMIRATQMYIEHLVLPFPSEVNERTYKCIYQGAFRLWSLLSKSDATFSDNVCLQNFRTVIKSVDGSIASTLKVDATQRRSALDNTSHSNTDSNYRRYVQYCHAVKILFIEVISVLCFGPGSYGSPQRILVTSLMEIVVNQKEKQTQDLTPFEWTSADETPVIRSVILQLILMREWDDRFDVGALIEDVMRGSISLGHDGSEQNHVDMCTLVVRCLEDKACMEWGVQEGQDAARVFETLQRQIEVSLRPFTEGRSNPSIASYRWLQSVAQLRFSLTVVASVLCDHIMDSPHKQELGSRARTQVSELIQLLDVVFQRDSFQDLNLFLSKQITRRRGISSLRTLYSQGLHFVLPQQLQSRHAHRSQPDHYIVCGRMYSDVRQSLVQSALDETADAFCTTVQSVDGDQVSFVPLAIFSKVTWPTTEVKTFDDEMIHHAMAGCSRQGNLNRKLTAMCHSLLQRSVGGRSTLMRPSTDLSSRSLTSLVVHTIATILSKVRHPLLEPFISILNPQQGLAGQYLPTMPEDFIVEAMTIMDMEGPYKDKPDMRGKFYACPNGHRYAITECTGPNQGRRCPTCTARIGSQGGQIAEGNYQVQRVAEKETGYILGKAATRSTSAVPERDLSPAVCAVMRFILHACFMWSACHCSEDALIHLHGTVPIQAVSLPEFFWQHLQLDLRVIAKALSHGEDDVVAMLTAVIQTMAECTNTNVNGSMASKDTRKTWERKFSRFVIQPVLSNLNNVISRAVQVITEDSAMAEDEVFLAVYEKTKMTPSLVQTLLTYRSKISLHELTSSLNNVADSKTLYPLLDKFLNEEPLFRALQYLPAVIRLQRVLVDYFAHWQNQNKAERLPIAKAILAAQGTSLNLRNDLEQTRKAWSIVREKLPHHRIAVPEELVHELADLADVQPVVYLLPTESGPGRCSLALADYLLYQQNELLEFCRRTAKFSWIDKAKIPVPELLPSHVVCYEGELDSVILTHCRYSLKFGQGHDIQYDFGALEKHIYNRFLVGKPTIDKATLPIMVYSGDVLQQEVFDRLRKNVKQQPALSHEDQIYVLSKLHRNLTEISRAVQTLTIAISFLASKGRNDPGLSLQRYIISVLKIRNTEFCKKLSLSQLIPLWETLAIEQSQLQSCNGKKIPFNGLDSVKDNFEDLSLDDHHAFEEWLSRFPAPDLWISLLFNFVQLRLIMTTIASSSNSFEWSLHDVLVKCLDDISDSESTFKDLSRDLESLPECILVKHAVHVWHLTVQLKVSQ